MYCPDCNSEIPQDRIDYARSKGFKLKYCQDCSKKRKAAREGQNSYAQPKQEQKDVNWDKIAYGKIAHNFLIEAYKNLKRDGESVLDPATVKNIKNEAYFWTIVNLEVQDMLDKKLNPPKP